MKLVLHNFRCHENKTFEFEKGLTLISAGSGKGKTTICNAIKFVLYGIGNKVITYGKKKCSVTLIMENIKIIRSKGPNRLLVDDKYEDNAAQDIINKIFGNSNFETISYLTQNAYNSFIMMSPINKLEFIETFAFKDINLKELKKKLKDKTQLLNKNLIECNSKLEVTKNILDDLDKPKKVEYPYEKKYSKKNQDIVYKNNNVRMKKCLKKITTINGEIENIREKIKDTNIYEIKTKSLSDKIKECNEYIDEISNKIKGIHVNDDEYLQRLNTTLKVITDNKEYVKYINILDSKKNTLIQMEKEELKNMEDEIKNIESEVLKEEEIIEIKEQIEILSLIIKTKEKINILKSKIYDIDNNVIEKIEKNILDNTILLESNNETIEKLKMQRNILKCPSCNVNLKFINNELTIHNIESNITKTCNLEELIEESNNLKSDIDNDKYNLKKMKEQLILNESINEKIRKEEILIEEYDDEDFDINEMKENRNDYIESLEYNDTILNKLSVLKSNVNNKQYSKTYVSFENDILRLEEKISKLDINLNNIVDEDEEEIRDKINNENRLRNELSIHKNQKLKIEKDIERYNNESNILNNNFISKYKNFVKSSNLDIILNDKIKELNEVKSEIEKYKKTIKNIEEYNNYITNLERYNEWNDKHEKLKDEEISLKNKYSASLLMKSKILEAESVVMVGIIESINKHAQIYLDLFFTDNPINVNIITFKKVKKVSKPQIDIEIHYKGMECNINMLSGGELSRVVLAFTLALGEIFNIPLLLLDECTANLDESLTSDVFEAIKNNFHAKYIVVIAHQIVCGQFDNIIKL